MMPPPRPTARKGPPPRTGTAVPVAKAEPPFSRPEERKDSQELLFTVDEDWRKEWKGMPEFVQESQKPYMTVLVHFESFENAQKFAELVGQKINAETKYMWFPKVDLKRVARFRYADEEPA